MYLMPWNFDCDFWVSWSFLLNNNHQAVNKMKYSYIYIYIYIYIHTHIYIYISSKCQEDYWYGIFVYRIYERFHIILWECLMYGYYHICLSGCLWETSLTERIHLKYMYFRYICFYVYVCVYASFLL